jgi:hypothetical protein
LVLVPVAPAEVTATRRGNAVEIDLIVPSANTDKTRPANVERVDIYALTGMGRVTDADVLARGERVASIAVKAPRDPDRTIDPDEPVSDLEPLEGDGVDQGARAHVIEELASMSGSSPRPTASAAPLDGRPLVGPACQPPTRLYVAVAVSTQGRRGPLSRQVGVPLGPPPAVPPAPNISYDEGAVTVAWPAALATPSAGDAATGILASTPVGCGAAEVAYHVYEIKGPTAETRLTEKPLPQPPFIDRRLEWGVERCYNVRAVQSYAGSAVESEPTMPVCEMLADSFAPAAPKGLVAVASEGAISLMWDANAEKDVAGYLVLRAPAATKSFAPVTADPVRETSFTDKVEPGTLYIYAVQAVDTHGNRSAASSEIAAEPAR